MKIKLLIARATAAGSQNRGDEIDVENAEALRMIEAGQAEPVRGIAPERTVKPARAERAKKG